MSSGGEKKKVKPSKSNNERIDEIKMANKKIKKNCIENGDESIFHVMNFTSLQ